MVGTPASLRTLNHSAFVICPSPSLSARVKYLRTCHTSIDGVKIRRKCSVCTGYLHSPLQLFFWPSLSICDEFVHAALCCPLWKQSWSTNYNLCSSNFNNFMISHSNISFPIKHFMTLSNEFLSKQRHRIFNFLVLFEHFGRTLRSVLSSWCKHTTMAKIYLYAINWQSPPPKKKVGWIMVSIGLNSRLLPMMFRLSQHFIEENDHLRKNGKNWINFVYELGRQATN